MSRNDGLSQYIVMRRLPHAAREADIRSFLKVKWRSITKRWGDDQGEKGEGRPLDNCYESLLAGFINLADSSNDCCRWALDIWISVCLFGLFALISMTIVNIAFPMDVVRLHAVGICYVELEDIQSAKEAARRFNCKKLGERTVHVSVVNSSTAETLVRHGVLGKDSSVQSCPVITVLNLPFDASEEYVKNLFKGEHLIRHLSYFLFLLAPGWDFACVLTQ
ncbi:unnamed protein product [Gongylonema pulchrum]|uniref:RRM domain-containing protein n=1 Tax=Gongylonema pulchrum TaxID=637853 RepID=A0A183DI35_9BILA|nr:unnamed protein product [Gongylonema pulchrum]